MVARVNEEFKVRSIEIWYDPLEMFRQIDKDNTIAEGLITGANLDNDSEAPGCPVHHG